MRICTWLLLTFFGLALCSLVQQQNIEESGMVSSHVPLMESKETQTSVGENNALLPMKYQ